MGNDDVAKWQKRIEETFSGPLGICGERLLLLQGKENKNSELLINKFGGFVRLIDAFFDFFIETFQNLSKLDRKKWSGEIAVITAIQVATFWRLRASYSIFWKGYFVDALSLLRAVLENVFQIAALKHGIITEAEVFGSLGKENMEKLSNDEAQNILRKNFRKADKKINSNFIGNQSNLSSETQEDLHTFINILHHAVHKSRLNLVSHYVPWIQSKRPLSVFPEYDESMATSYINYLEFLTWMIVKTLPLLQVKPNEFPESWQDKYQILDESFQQAISGFEKRMGRSIEELVAKKFKFVGGV